MPADLSIVGFDDYPYARYMIPALTTVRNRIYDMGYLGCEIVDHWIKGRDQEYVQGLRVAAHRPR